MKTLTQLALVLALAPQALMAAGRPGFNSVKIMDCSEIARAPYNIYRADVTYKTRDFGPASMVVEVATRVQPDELIAQVACTADAEKLSDINCEEATSLVDENQTVSVSFDGIEKIIFMDLTFKNASGSAVHHLACEAVEPTN